MAWVLDPTLAERARDGDLAALDALLRGLQPVLHRLAVRMLGRQVDAEDAVQEILLKITTHLSTWRGESRLDTWAFGIASHHLLNLRTRNREGAHLSFEALGERLDAGLALAEAQGFADDQASPEERLLARETALSCTQAMLLCLDPPGRLAYVLDVVFGLDSEDAAAVQGIQPAAHRKRLSRARSAVHGFMSERCGLVSAEARCRCLRQGPAKRAAGEGGRRVIDLRLTADDLDRASEGLRELVAMGDAAAVFRGAPTASASDAAERIRAVVERSRFLRH